MFCLAQERTLHKVCCLRQQESAYRLISTCISHLDAKLGGTSTAWSSQDALCIGHAADAGNKGRKSAHYGHKPRQHHSLAAILPVEVLGLCNKALRHGNSHALTMMHRPASYARGVQRGNI